MLGTFLLTNSWGDIGSSGGGAGAVQQLNNSILDIVTYAGAIVVAIGVTQMIIAFHEQNAAAKTKSAMMVGLGILFLTAKVVIDTLGLYEAKPEAKEVVKNALSVLGSGLKYAGIVLAGIAIFQLVMAMANEDAREKADGTKTIGVAIALVSANAIMNLISQAVFKEDAAGKEIVETVFGVIVYVARYVGIGFAGIGIFHMALALKDGDAQGKAKSALFVATGAILISMKLVIEALHISL